MKKQKAIYQLLTNVLLWLCVVVVTGVIYFIRGNSPASPFPLHEVTRFIDFWLLFTVAAAGLLLFAGFSIARQRSASEKDKERADYFADLVLDEGASVLYNFGSLLAACVTVGASAWYLIVTLFCYGVGYYLKPNDDELSA